MDQRQSHPPDHIGFEMHDIEAGSQGSRSHVPFVTQIDINSSAAVGPTPVHPPPPGSSMYIAADQPVLVQPIHPASVDQITPGIGFENFENGVPTEVVTEKTPSRTEGSHVDADDITLLANEESVKKVSSSKSTLCFRDGVKKIDFVLAYEPGSGSTELRKREKQKKFEANLKQMGLELEYEGKESSKTGKTCFVKVHVPWQVLAKYAEFMNMKMPLALNDMDVEYDSCWDMFPSPFKLDEDIVKPEDNYFTAPFSRERVEQFVIENKDTFFTNAQRSRIAYTILSRCVYEEDSSDISNNKFGVKKLLGNGVYQAAFPLHDGHYKSEHSILTMGKANDRHLLYETWAKPSKWYKYQPLDQIRNYFGEKIGIYFAWLGFYTYMLLPAAVVGLVAFFYGIGTLFDDIPSSEICDETKAGSLIMCPLCDQRCSYWKLVKSCNYSRATYLFDNYATVAFAAFMALWASFFHEIWKRQQAEIEYDWDVSEFEQEEETVRPEFEATVHRRRLNPINKIMEPFVPIWSKCWRYFTTITVLIFFFCLVLAAVFGVIVYRIVIAAVLYSSSDGIIRERTSFIASATAACINLVIILVLNFVYQKIALGLTNIEQHKTETEWEDAFTFKMYLFQFVNYYSSIIYIAFFKGRFVGRPGNYDYNLLNMRQEECDPAGCLIELCLQLAIIMVGKQVINNFKEIILPKLVVWFRSRAALKKKDEEKVYSRWERDYHLATMPALGLFDEYLEMVIQYGFVTIFVAAFPLAPLFAFLNNVTEIRLDAYKFVTQWRRPLAARAQDIGIWYGILRGISAMAVVTNAIIIAFTSEFIPKLVYQHRFNNGSLDGYTEFSLSHFQVEGFQNSSRPLEIDSSFGSVTECRYRDFRNRDDPDRFTEAYWEVLVARLAFVVVFENLVVFLSWLVMYLIPDIPYYVKMQILREKFIGREALYSADRTKTQEKIDKTRPDASPLY